MKLIGKRTIPVILLLLAGGPALSKGQTDRPEPPPQIWTLTVSPAATPTPALRYRFTLPVYERVEGNAVPLYLMNMLRPEAGEADLATLATSELEGERLEEAKQALGRYTTALHQFELASRRNRAEWGIPVREEGITALLPHLNGTRNMAHALALRARIRVTEGDIQGAVESIRVGYTLARHLDQDAVLIQGLVATGIAVLMNRQVMALMEYPEGPNLYWALADLPKPLLDGPEIIRREQAFVYFSIPALQRARRGELSADEWRQVARDLMSLKQDITGRRHPADDFAAALMAAASLPAARAFHRQRGLTDEQIDAIPIPQLLGEHHLYLYEMYYDEQMKWWNVPFWQAWPQMRDSEAELKDKIASEMNPMLALMPSLSRARLTMTLLERQIAALMTVEALRAYAAVNDGRLPESLDQLSNPPAAIDPIHGRFFEYTQTDEGFVLISPPPPGENAFHELRVEVTLRKNQ